jgi:tetratricopeptide (TPR) repeat protein
MEGRRNIYIFRTNGMSVNDRQSIIDGLRKLHADVVDVRVAMAHLEVDIKGELDEAALSFIGGDMIARVPAELYASLYDDIFNRALCLIKEERFWESHEALEQIWKKSSGSRKDYLHFLILCSAAMVHYQRGRQEVSLGIIKRAVLISPINTYEIDAKPLLDSCERSITDNDPRRLYISLMELGQKTCRNSGPPTGGP